ncbi:MAG: peptide chain release factor N(5)-glutamine methyltransferase [Chloroflexota bacterium]
MPVLQVVLREAITRLTEAGCESPRLDAEVLYAHGLGQDRSWLYAHNQDTISSQDYHRIQALIDRRACREPVAYITRHRAFFGLDFIVTPAVLIPRPETELLIEFVLEHSSCQHPQIVDVGTGSGCIAISLATQMPTARIVALDISFEALVIAKQNVHKHAVSSQVQLVQANLTDSLCPAVDILISNPPYISSSEMDAVSPDIYQHEPHLALTDDDDGLRLIHKLLSDASRVILPKGLLLMEIGSRQGQAVLDLAHRLCPTAKFEIKADLSGRDRVLLGRF